MFDDLHLTAGPGRIGLDGAGGSTLLGLLAGRLPPSPGTVRLTGQPGHLPQDPVPDASHRVDEILGVDAERAAPHAVEPGGPAEEVRRTAARPA